MRQGHSDGTVVRIAELEAERDSARTDLADAEEAVEYWKAEALANCGPS